MEIMCPRAEALGNLARGDNVPSSLGGLGAGKLDQS